MVFKQISFGNDSGQLINDIKIKKKIIQYLFNAINLSKYRYTFLNNINRLKFLKENEHFVSPNFHGYNYLLIFTNINDVNMAVMIDRRKLKYNLEHIDYNKLVCTKLECKVSKKIYKGTILDGKFIRNKNDYIFLVQDIYQLMGNNILDQPLDKKIEMLDNTMNTYFSSTPFRNFSIKINKLYTYYEIDILINKVMKNCSLMTNGIIFFPKYSGISIIYLEQKDTLQKNKVTISESNSYKTEKYDKPKSELSSNTTADIILNMKGYLHGRKYGYEAEKSKNIGTFEVRKTDIPDVYDLYLTNQENKLVRQGIAHIPNMKISHLCQDIFRDKNKEIMKCIHFQKFNKWIPMSKSDNKEIDNVDIIVSEST
jgi:hypothetical protein